MPDGTVLADKWRARPDQWLTGVGLFVDSAPGITQACSRIGLPLAFLVQAPVTFSCAFFRGTALVRYLDGAFLFNGLAADFVGGFLLRCG